MSGRTLRSLIMAGLLGLAGNAQAVIPAGERTVLLDFYASTNGATWTTSTNWNGAVGPECTWYGVTCDAGGTMVTGIDLSSNNLTGSLPANLQNLTNPAYFYGNLNQLTGSIPALAGLTNLRTFRVNIKQLTGNVPTVPSPSALAAGNSSLCPNLLNHSTDTAWDIATGDTPWSIKCIGLPPALQGTVSRKVHGSAGTFDLALSLVATNPTTESRQGPAQTIVFTFDKPLSAATVNVTEGTATAAAPTSSGNDVFVAVSGVTNQQLAAVSLTNVVSTDGGGGGSGSARVGFLVGDVNQTRVVSVADLGRVNAQLSQEVTVANFLKNVNASGTLTLADKGIANANLTRALPPP